MVDVSGWSLPKGVEGYTKNQYLPDASIVERYIAEEAIEFCSEYIETATPVGLPQSFHDCTWEGRGTRGLNVVTMDHRDVSQVHLYVLTNTPKVIPYIDAHKQNVTVTHPKMNMMRVLYKNTIEHSSTSLEKQSSLMTMLPKH